MASWVVFIILLWTWTTAAAGQPSPLELLASLPKCASPCVLESIVSLECSLVDTSLTADCICVNIPTLAIMSECVQLACPYEEQVITAQLQNTFCATYPIADRGYEMILVIVIGLSITIPFVILRCVSRLKMTRKLWADDWTCITAMVFVTAMAATQIKSASMGFGMHFWNVDPLNGINIRQLFWAAQMCYIFVQVTAKASILIFYSRVFASRWLKVAVKAGITFLVTHGILFMLLVVFQCLPVRAIWETHLERKCLNMTAIGYAGAIFSIVEDIIILFLPIPELIKLQLGMKKKMALIFIFMLGAFACITSMVRLKFMVTFSSSFDTTWDNIGIVIWSTVELYVAILCASIPAVRPLIALYLPRFLGSSKSKYALKDSENAGSSGYHRRNPSHQLNSLRGGSKARDPYLEIPSPPVTANPGSSDLGKGFGPAQSEYKTTFDTTDIDTHSTLSFVKQSDVPRQAPPATYQTEK